MKLEDEIGVTLVRNVVIEGHPAGAVFMRGEDNEGNCYAFPLAEIKHDVFPLCAVPVLPVPFLGKRVRVFFIRGPIRARF